MITSPRFWSRLCAVTVLANVPALRAVSPMLSPENWSAAERAAAETLERTSWKPLRPRTIESHDGLVSATVSPIAVLAGVEALRRGGSAADAAATTAITQVVTQLGSVVSFAGVFTMVYYDAHDRRVYALDAGFNSFAGEKDPLTIPATRPLATTGAAPVVVKDGGRLTLVPGFVAGIEALHQRFGKLPFGELFAPGIWYARHGVTLSPPLAYFFSARADAFARTEDGRRFLSQAGNALPRLGDRFVQSDLAATLTTIAEHGAAAFYAGDWAKTFVRRVREEGGKAELQDLENYRATWSEPRRTHVFGCDVFTNGAPGDGAFAIIPALNIAERLRLDAAGPYWSDPLTFRRLDRIAKLLAAATSDQRYVSRVLAAQGIAASGDPLSKAYADQIAAGIDTLSAPPAGDAPRHSNAIVVVDREGNIAAVTHTINTVIWGGTGIVVGGVPIPDPAGFQQQKLAAIPAGGRVPHEIIDLIALRDGAPVLATASIGSSLYPQTLGFVLSVLGQKLDAAAAASAAPLLLTFDPAAFARTTVPAQAYGAVFLDSLRREGLQLVEIPPANADALRGTLAFVQLEGGIRRTAEDPSAMVFGGGD